MEEQHKKIITILGQDIPMGVSKEINFNVANLYTTTNVEVPIIIERSKISGPTVLLTAGIHGDEVNGVEIVRQVISKGINKPKRGTIICIPIVNVFGFLNGKREFPDGRDLNRMFPGNVLGSLASRAAYKLVNEIIPDIDFILDFHTGGANRFNAAQIRITNNNQYLKELATVFDAPFVLFSNTIPKSFRASCQKFEKPILLFEGGKSNFIDESISEIGLNGVKRVLSHLDMLQSKHTVKQSQNSPIFIEDSKWIRAKKSGMFCNKTKVNDKIKSGDILGEITDPYGKISYLLRSTLDGHIINVNESPMVYQGDAIFHVATKFYNP